MGIINNKLEEEILMKMEKINGNPQYFNVRKENVSQSLKSLGDIYSFWIENPELRKNLLMENKQPKTIKKMARKGIHQIQNAWYFLHERKNEFGNNFIDLFNEFVLKKVNQLIEPSIIGTGDYRKKDVTLNFRNYTPPSWEKVPKKMNKLIKDIKLKYVDNPLESGILAHLGIVGIQPFMDGNKRTARLIQNRILHSVDMPPAMIPAGEGKFYFDLLRRILPSYNEDNLEGQRQFYDYCASKVNNGLDDILDDLKI